MPEIVIKCEGMPVLAPQCDAKTGAIDEAIVFVLKAHEQLPSFLLDLLAYAYYHDLAPLFPGVSRGHYGQPVAFRLLHWQTAQRIVALLFVAAIMLGIKPMLLWSVSFQLSFAAMCGLVFLFPKFQTLRGKAISFSERAGWRASSTRFFIDAGLVSLSAILFVSPLIPYYFERVCIVSLPATLLTLPALPGIILASTLTAVVELFLLPLAQALGWAAWLFTSYAIEVVELFSALPFAALGVKFGVPAICGYYFALAFWLSDNWERLLRQKKV